MNISISTYHVKKGDTFSSVARKLGISVEALKRYHNTYCDLKNLIGNDIDNIREIIIPPSEKIKYLKDDEKQIQSYNYLPSPHLTDSFYASEYEVTERFEQQNQEDMVIDYSISVELQENMNKGFLAKINTYDFKKNGQSSDDKISILSLACMKSILPIEFIVPAQGMITKIYNHKALIKKFENKRFDLDDFFIGEINQSYLDKLYTSIKNENYLLRQFQSALLYQVVFPEMDWFRRKKEWEAEFFVIQNSFPVRCIFRCEYNFENANEVTIIIKGKIEENCGLQELLKGVKLKELSEKKINGEIELYYTLTKETKQLKKIEASITLLNEEETYHKHNLMLKATGKEEPIRKFSTLIED